VDRIGRRISPLKVRIVPFQQRFDFLDSLRRQVPISSAVLSRHSASAADPNAIRRCRRYKPGVPKCVPSTTFASTDKTARLSWSNTLRVPRMSRGVRGLQDRDHGGVRSLPCLERPILEHAATLDERHHRGVKSGSVGVWVRGT